MNRTIVLKHIFILLAALYGCEEANRAPTIDFVEDKNVIVGNEMQIFIFASDPDGDPLAFTLEEAPEGARLEQQGNQALFRWAPLITQAETGGKSYLIRLTVTDTKGAFATQEWTITALFEGGVPFFITPSGFVTNMAKRNSVGFLVEVKDDDDVTVNLTMAESMEGALFQQVSGKVASFFWKPTEEQISESSFWSILVTADDGLHPIVQFPISIILVNADADACPGTPPSIQHIALPDQHDSPPYVITANATDAESGIESMTLQWRAFDSTTPVSVPMARLSPGVYQGEIDSPPIPGSQATVLLYRLLARDNDDITGDTCDHEVSVPKNADLAFVAYGPDAPDACVEDIFEPNETVENASPLSEGIHAALRSCGGDDWYKVNVPAGRALVSTLFFEPEHGVLSLAVATEDGQILKESFFSGSQEVLYGPVSVDTTLTIQVTSAGETAMTYALQVDLVDGGCEPDTLEPNDGFEEAKTLNDGVYDNLVICPGDQDWYAFDLIAGDHLRLDLFFDQAGGDLDLRLLAADGTTPLASSITVTSDEQIEFDAYQDATVYAVVSGFEANSNEYTFIAELKDQIDGCKDDIVSPNDSFTSAYSLTQGTLSGLMACPGHPDYFKYTLNGGETITVQVTPELETNSPLVSLENISGENLPGSRGPKDGGSYAQTTVAGPGPVYIKVTPLQTVAAPYGVNLDVSYPNAACVPDRLEPNQNINQAKEVEGPITSLLTLCPGDEDWLYLYVSAYSTVEIRAKFEDAQDGLKLGLHAINGEELTSATSENGEAFLSTFIEEAGAYYIRVHGSQGMAIPYDLISVFN